MTGWHLLMSGWDFEPSVLLGCAALLLLYMAALRFRPPLRAWYFVAGIATLMMALISPIDTLADRYLFSAHMLQHILLILVVPPLLILGIPMQLAEAMLRWQLIAKAERVLSLPVIAWTLGVGAMWLWHWPPLYNAALAHEPLHIAEHLIFLITATIFWWPIISPIEGLRLLPLAAIVYLFSACTAHTVLAILITFAPVGIYPAYLHPVDTLNLLPLIREYWRLTPNVDQQWGGLLMWVPACLIYLSFILATLVRWYRIRDLSVPSFAAGQEVFAVAEETPGGNHGP